MIVEYNPLHRGHLHLLEAVREELGRDTAAIAVMSGGAVQRGEFALAGRLARARAAVESGVDLVLELPVPWAAASAERFADGGVQALLGTGLVTHLAFGSESGDAGALERLARTLCDSRFPALLKEELAAGDSFAAARQRAVGRLAGPALAALLAKPNDLLGVEYHKALLRRRGNLEVLAVPRSGAAHDAKSAPPGEYPSSSAIRALLRAGRRGEALALMAPAMARSYEEEERAGRAPVFPENSERAVLSRLRSMKPEDFAALDQGGEGLHRRLYAAAREGRTVAEVLETAKTRRYSHARLRRMVLWAYLGMTPEEQPDRVPYLRVLGASGTGRALLRRMEGSGGLPGTASIPVLTKPAHIRSLGPEARAVWDLEERCADLYALAYPALDAARGGGIWREGPVML